jgi:hypothetical protein
LQCDTRHGACRKCDGDANLDDCPSGTQCQPKSLLCVQCVYGSQCPKATPLCDLPAGRCVVCQTSLDCFPRAPFCDPSSHECSTGL